MPADGGSDSYQRFERALEGLRAGPGLQAPSSTAAAGQNTSARQSPPGLTAEQRLDPGLSQGQDQGIQMDDFVQDTADMERDLRRRSRLLPIGIALMLLSAFGAVVWFAFADPSAAPDGQQTVELIQADPEPVKSKPEDPGGMKVQHQDKLILNPDPEKPQVERLLPPPEAPLPVPEASASAETAEGAPADREDVTDSPVVVTESAEAGSASLQEDGENSVAKATDTAKTAIEQAGASAAQLAEKTQDSASQTVAKVQPKAEKAAKERVAPKPAEPKPLPKVAEAAAVTPKPVAPKVVAPKVETAKPVTQTAKVPTDSGYILQLASLRSEKDALQEWGRIQGENKNLLSRMKPIVEKADIEGIGTRYRLQTGPFPTKATAQDLCAQLKAAKQDCLVKRR
ncbi:SPOR domain-containing protein [Pelagibius sp. Alg239-R121]|uniref:SPOR domain-containing protein n=1 Tax=Pelagibius sp. Alg239-R121 TaxID=2993448 RepID=UPI0024A73714|nr:SPOR domain-containing protein [Pelagibius sp. Alg239-R121]